MSISEKPDHQINKLKNEILRLRQELSKTKTSYKRLQKKIKDKQNKQVANKQKAGEEPLVQYAESLNFLSHTATQMLGSLSLPELFRLVSDRLYAVASGALISFSEYNPLNNKLIIREVRCTTKEREKLQRVLGQEPEGLELDFPKEIRSRFIPGSLDFLEGGFYDLVFGQLPRFVCQEFEKELNIGNIFAMACAVDDDILGTVAILTHDSFMPENKNLIESIINQGALALKRKRAEEALRESEQRLQGILNNAAVGIVELDHEDRLIAVNDRICKILGYSQEELLGRLIFDFIAPEDIPHSREITKRFYSEEIDVLDFEKRYLRKDGSVIWVHVSISAIHDSKGHHIRTIRTIEDITERKMMEQSLIESEEMFSTMFQAAPIGISLATFPDGVIYSVNQAWLNLTGYEKKEDVLGKTSVNLGLIRDPKEQESILKEFQQYGSVRNAEATFLSKTGEQRTVSVNLDVIRLRGQKYLLSTNEDITERNKSAKELQKSGQKLKLALEIGNIGIWEWDLKTNLMYFDERMRKMLGFEKDTLELTYEEFETLLNEEDIPHFKEAINTDVAFETVYRIKTNDGKSKYINTKGVVERDKNDNPVKMIGVCFDITEMKKGAEKALFKVNEELLRSNKELQQFAYVASHDLQEPLRMVTSFTQLLAIRYKDKLDKNADEYIDFAVNGAKRMQNLINGLLTYSRVQTKSMEFTNVDLLSVLKKVINSLRFRIQETDAKITNEELPVIKADEGQMEQLLQNLISNALKFNKRTPEIHISCKKGEHGSYLFSIEDNGIGIENQYFDKIFQIFQRLVAQYEEYEGTGIGLSICKKIIERHGGKIWLESEIDKGSIFYFTLEKTKLLK